MNTNQEGYCRIISEDEIDRALTELYIEQGKYKVENGKVYDIETGKYISELK